MGSNIYQPEIDGLRAIAVLAVLLYHFGIPLFTGGFVGVDVFFVISGYLITKTVSEDLEANRFSFRRFYLARVRRIAPALLATTMVSFLVGALTMAPAAFQELSESALAVLLSVSNIHFWLSSGYFDAVAASKPLLHTWSLGVEEQFYFVWPAFLVAGAKLEWPWRMASLSLIALASLIASQISINTDPTGAYYLLPSRAFELAVGGLLAISRFSRSIMGYGFLREIGFAVGIFFILIASTLFTTLTPFPGIDACLPVMGAALVIVFGHTRCASIMLANRFSGWVGKISYSIYLVHWPLLVFVKYVLMRDLSTVEVCICLGATFAISTLLHAHVEQPFRRKSEGTYIVPSLRLLKLAAFGTLAVFVLAWGAADAGWEWRLQNRRNAYVYGLENPKKFHRTFYGGRTCSMPRCEARAHKGRRVYVLGDSHARALYAGLIKTFPNIDFVVYAPDACPFYSRKFTSQDAFSRMCNKAKSMAFAEIAEKPAPIILTEHWATRWASPHYSIVDPDSAPLKLKTTDEFAAFVARQLKDLKKLIGEHDLIAVGGVPRFGSEYSLIDCMGRPLQRRGCSASKRRGRVAQQEIINRSIYASIERDVTFIDPYDFLCDEQSCRNVDDGNRPIYSDDSHLSRWGSVYLISKMKVALSEALSDQKSMASEH
jgi:peptidoglycan/LPS O-acetylase OafA/YrhL